MKKKGERKNCILATNSKNEFHEVVFSFFEFIFFDTLIWAK